VCIYGICQFDAENTTSSDNKTLEIGSGITDEALLAMTRHPTTLPLSSLIVNHPRPANAIKSDIKGSWEHDFLYSCAF
jgi:hypothetical protein